MRFSLTIATAALILSAAAAPAAPRAEDCKDGGNGTETGGDGNEHDSRHGKFPFGIFPSGLFPPDGAAVPTGGFGGPPAGHMPSGAITAAPSPTGGLSTISFGLPATEAANFYGALKAKNDDSKSSDSSESSDSSGSDSSGSSDSSDSEEGGSSKDKSSDESSVDSNKKKSGSDKEKSCSDKEKSDSDKSPESDSSDEQTSGSDKEKSGSDDTKSGGVESTSGDDKSSGSDPSSGGDEKSSPGSGTESGSGSDGESSSGSDGESSSGSGDESSSGSDNEESSSGSGSTGGSSGNSTTTPSPSIVSSTKASGSFPQAAGESTLSEPMKVTDFDGKMARFGRGVKCSGGEGGDSDAVFIVADGGSLSNVIIGADQIEGVHCVGACTITNVWWEAVCEDALSFKGDGDGVVSGGGAKGAQDKVVQHNGMGTVSISNFYVEDFGKLYRSCGNCKTMGERHVKIDGVTASGGTSALIGINSNYGDTATITKSCIKNTKIVCEEFEGNNKGDEPSKISNGPSSACIYTDADINAC